MNTTTFNATVSDEVVLNALLYLDERYVDGQHIDLPGFMMDNGIHMSATMLHRLCDYGVLTVAHDGINVDQEVPEFSYVYHGVDDRFCVGLKALRTFKEFINNPVSIKDIATGVYYRKYVNNDVTEQGILDTLNAYWSVWSEFFPGWQVSIESRILWGAPSTVAACSPIRKRIVWFADSIEVRDFASQLGMHWQTYIRVAMAHELGHASDVYLKDSYLLGDFEGESANELTVMFERHAWVNGRVFVSDSEADAYERLNQRNIEVYTKNTPSNKGIFGLAVDPTMVEFKSPAFRKESSLSNLYVQDVPSLPLWVFAKEGKAMQLASFFNKHHHFCHISHRDVDTLFKTAKGTNVDFMRILGRANPAPNAEMNKRVFISFDRNSSQFGNQALAQGRELMLASVARKLKGKPVKIYTSNKLVKKVFRENGVHCFFADFDVLAEVGTFVHLLVLDSHTKSELSVATRSLFMGNRIVPAFY